MCCKACCLAEFDSSDKMIRDSDGREVFLWPPLPPWTPNMDMELQKLPVREAPPNVEPRKVPTALGRGLFAPAATPFLWVDSTVTGAPENLLVFILLFKLTFEKRHSFHGITPLYDYQSQYLNIKIKTRLSKNNPFEDKLKAIRVFKIIIHI